MMPRMTELASEKGALREEIDNTLDENAFLKGRVEELESHADALSGELELAKGVIEELEAQLERVRALPFYHFGPDKTAWIKADDLFKAIKRVG